MLNITDVNRTLKSCTDTLDLLGIRYGEVVRITVNTRAKKRLGCCSIVSPYREGNVGKFEIQVASAILENGTQKDLNDTIMHELIHTCPDSFNHGAVWKSIASRVHKYGYNVTRCADVTNMSVELYSSIKNAEHKYTFHCEKCGKVIGRDRKSRFTENYGAYRCATCGGHFVRDK